MSNFSKLMQQAASGVGGGGDYQNDASDSVTSLWILNSVGGEFSNGQNNTAQTLGVKSDHTVIIGHNDDNQVELVEVATDGTVGTKLKLDVEQRSYAGLAIDPFDEDYIYLGGEIGTGGTQYVMKLRSDLSTTTPEWQKLYNIADMGSIDSFNPQFTENYIYQIFTANNPRVTRLVRYDRDGGNVSAWEITYDGVSHSGNTYAYAISEDASTLYFLSEFKNDDICRIIAINLNNNTKRWAKKVSNGDLIGFRAAVDNSDNGLVAAIYDNLTDDTHVIKFSESDGTIEWQNAFGDGTTNRHLLDGIKIKKDGSIGALAGYKNSSPSENSCLLTFDPSDGTFSSNMYFFDRPSGNTSTRFFGGNNTPYILGDRIYHSFYTYDTNFPNTFSSYGLKLDTTISTNDAVTSVGTFPASKSCDIEIVSIPTVSATITFTADTASLSMTSVSTTNMLDSNSTVTVSTDTTETYYTENWRS